MRLAFRILAFCFGLTAIFHAAQAAHVVGTGDHAARHALFALIDALAAVGVLVRPPSFAAVFAVLTGQQLASHGADLVRSWQAGGGVDWSDVAVLVVMPLTLALLVRDTRSRRRDRRPSTSGPRLG